MKNVHLLPTDKPSRLFKDNFGKFLLISINIDQGQDNFKSYHIYITSDEVKKHGDWVISNLNEVTRFRSLYCQNEYRKIILTTDQDLIKDGVQSIDDDFLEWFVKNPTCESVEVKNISIKVVKGYNNNGEIDCYYTNGYEIIIPLLARRN
jgi:hypothetical protein